LQFRKRELTSSRGDGNGSSTRRSTNESTETRASKSRIKRENKNSGFYGGRGPTPGRICRETTRIIKSKSDKLLGSTFVCVKGERPEEGPKTRENREEGGFRCCHNRKREMKKEGHRLNRKRLRGSLVPKKKMCPRSKNHRRLYNLSLDRPISEGPTAQDPWCKRGVRPRNVYSQKRRPVTRTEGDKRRIHMICRRGRKPLMGGPIELQP